MTTLKEPLNEEEREVISRYLNVLRLDLKTWEKDFANSNNGKKASRDDIKRNPEIAQKYKHYAKNSDILSGKVPFKKDITMTPSKNQTPRKSRKSRKRKHEGDAQPTISKQVQILQTPSKSAAPWELDPYDSPHAIRSLFTPSKRMSIAPTPQKDGLVLGLFDLISTTPDKSRGSLVDRASITLTPRKLDSLGLTTKHSRTPGSTSKRTMMDMFATPKKSMKFDGEGVHSPSSVSKLHLATPSFLRRDSQRIRMPPVNEDDANVELSPQMIRIPRKPVVRGLSSMLASLRKMEEDAADEDLEALHDMENDTMVAQQQNPALASKPQVLFSEDILVADSQPGFPLGAFDDEAANDSDPESHVLDQNGLPLKVYKKKGQKRTTRRSRMKPNTSKPALAVSPNFEEDSDDELADEAVLETQITTNFDDVRNFASDSGSEYTASEGGTRYRRPDQSKKRKVMTKDGTIRTVTRKVGTLASQNFKRLKLRNSGAKGPVAHDSRYRRKR